MKYIIQILIFVYGLTAVSQNKNIQIKLNGQLQDSYNKNFVEFIPRNNRQVLTINALGDFKIESMEILYEYSTSEKDTCPVKLSKKIKSSVSINLTKNNCLNKKKRERVLNNLWITLVIVNSSSQKSEEIVFECRS